MILINMKRIACRGFKDDCITKKIREMVICETEFGVYLFLYNFITCGVRVITIIITPRIA